MAKFSRENLELTGKRGPFTEAQKAALRGTTPFRFTAPPSRKGKERMLIEEGPIVERARGVKRLADEGVLRKINKAAKLLGRPVPLLGEAIQIGELFGLF